MRAVLLGIALLIAGCATSGPRAAPDTPLPSAAAAVEAHNARVARLDRLWARAIVTLRFTDENGNEKWEQGDGYFQMRDASKLALSIGKVGEVLLWIGCDEERYWVLNRLNDPIAYTGRHDLLTGERLARAGLPVPPRELLRLGGLLPIDSDGVEVSRDAEGFTLVTTSDDAGAWRYVFEPAPTDDMPLRVERLDADDEVVLRASLEQPGTVKVQDGLGFPPRTFGRLLVTHEPTGDSISILLDGDIIDGRRRGVPKKQVFDLDVLLDAYGPFDRVVDLDVSEPG